MLKTTPLLRGRFGGYLLPHKGFQDAGTFSRLVGTTPLLRGTLTPLDQMMRIIIRLRNEEFAFPSDVHRQKQNGPSQ